MCFCSNVRQDEALQAEERAMQQQSHLFATQQQLNNVNNERLGEVNLELDKNNFTDISFVTVLVD